MKTYIDDSYSVLGGTILHCQNQESVIEVPAQLGGQTITAIGRNAFSFLDDMEQLILPNTIQRIGNGAFTLCRKLKDIKIKDLPLTRGAYDALQAKCVVAGDLFVASEFPNLPVVREAITALSKPVAHGFPLAAHELFYDDRPFDELGLSGLGMKRRLLFSKSRPEDPEPMLSEQEAFMALIRRDSPGLTSGPAEEKNDELLRFQKKTDIFPCTLFAFDRASVKEENGLVYITVNIDRDRVCNNLFWQSKRSVVLDGKRYYIYFRNYLYSENKDPDYIRRGMLAFSDEGPVKGEKAQDVINKYTLSAIL